MPHAQELYQWTERVQRLFPDLRPHHARDLAHYSFGAALARSCGLVRVLTHLVALLVCSYHALRQRLRELYQPAGVQRGAARSAFDHTLCFAPLLRWAASGQKDRRLALALDPTCHLDRFRVLCVSVLYQGAALPVAWAVQAADQKGSWNDIWQGLLGRLKEALGDGWEVLVLTDRGLESAELFRAIVALGWHPLMRVKGGGKFRPTGWRRGHSMRGFAAAVGCRWAGVGLAYPTGERLPATLLACWEAGHAEAWLLLTDLPARAVNPAWYAWRMWIEHGFKVCKSGCWQWQRTRMTDPQRAARLWAVLAVATLWLMEVGGEGAPLGLPPLPGQERLVSLVQAGLLRLLGTLWRGEALPQGRLLHQDWPARDWEPDQLTEAMMDQS
jgi:hypothetical protein